mmetsp:Transcript_19993/g.47265  ORF Transcript_19993/g.47265 Transcript_19993/m.47265 type:complete len:307 (-) Transcript_19993:277-1197(-)
MTPLFRQIGHGVTKHTSDTSNAVIKCHRPHRKVHQRQNLRQSIGPRRDLHGIIRIRSIAQDRLTGELIDKIQVHVVLLREQIRNERPKVTDGRDVALQRSPNRVVQHVNITGPFHGLLQTTLRISLGHGLVPADGQPVLENHNRRRQMDVGRLQHTKQQHILGPLQLPSLLESQVAEDLLVVTVVLLALEHNVLLGLECLEGGPIEGLLLEELVLPDGYHAKFEGRPAIVRGRGQKLGDEVDGGLLVVGPPLDGEGDGGLVQKGDGRPTGQLDEVGGGYVAVLVDIPHLTAKYEAVQDATQREEIV